MSKQSYSTCNLFIRSLIFSAASLLIIVTYSSVSLFGIPFSLQYRHKVIRFFVGLYMSALRNICHINYVVEGIENIPHDRGGIVLCKHQSTWETFFLPLLFRDPAVIAKRELLWIPFFGWGLAVSDPITINRSNKASAMQQIIKKGKQCLDAGRWVIFFPEGTRVAAGTVGKYHLGGARLSVATGYPVTPVAHNAGWFWPRRKFIKRPGTIKVVVGPAIDPANRTAEEVLELAKQWIETTMLRIDSLVDKSAR